MTNETHRWYAARTSVEEVEEGRVLAPKFDKDGLIPVVTTDYETGEVLMVANMNASRSPRRSNSAKRSTGAAAASSCGTKERRAGSCRRCANY